MNHQVSNYAGLMNIFLEQIESATGKIRNFDTKLLEKLVDEHRKFAFTDFEDCLRLFCVIAVTVASMKEGKFENVLNCRKRSDSNT